MLRLKKFVLVMLIMLGIQSISSAMVCSESAWTGDGDSGISSSKVYTHAVNNRENADPIMVNGVEFSCLWDNTATYNLNGGGRINWDSGNNITGGSYELSTMFRYDNSMLVLSGLTPSALYEVTLFSVGWNDDNAPRIVTLTDTQFGSTFEFNQEKYGKDNGIKVVCVYKSNSNGELRLGLTNNFHIYAVANCEYTGSVSNFPVNVVTASPAKYIAGVRVDLDAVMTWNEEFPGILSNPGFDVYLDPNEAKVEAMDPSTLLSAKQSPFSYDPELVSGTDYFWRVATYINATDAEPNQITAVSHFQTLYTDEHWTGSAWTNDADSEISVGKHYTHKVNYNANELIGNTLVNGVLFENDSNRTGANWSLAGADATAGGTHYVTGTGGTMVSTMYHGQNAALTLTGLTPGADYVLNQYTRGWGATGGRLVSMTTSADGRTMAIDGNLEGDGNGYIFKYAYTAPESGELTVTYTPVVSGDTWHHYAFSNEVVVPAYVEPALLPGSSVETDVQLSWALVGDIDNLTYNVKVATDAAMTNVVSSDTGLTDATFTPGLNADTTYYWQVEIVEAGLVIYASPVWDIRTGLYESWTDTVWTNDSNSGISAGKTYTHKVNYNASQSASTIVNGVVFENDSDRVGVNGDWSLSGARDGTGNGHNVAGDGGTLVTSMYYNSDAVLTLTGLTPGTSYTLTQYTRGWGDAGGRMVEHFTNVLYDGVVLDGNHDGNGNGHLFMYHYIAPESGKLVIKYNPLAGDSWHHYAFSNEIVKPVYADPTPVPGSNANADVELSWVVKGVVDAPTYNVKVATDAAMANLVIDTNVADTAFTPYLNSNTTYYWQIEIVDGGSVVYTSPIWNFETTPPQDATKTIEWKFDETAGTIASQTGSSAAAGGTLVGYNDPADAHVAGLVGNSLRLNGKDEYVDISATASYMPTDNGQSFAVSGYFRTFSQYGPLFSMRNSELDNPLIDIAVGYDGYDRNPGHLCVLVRDDERSMAGVTSNIAVNDGRWHNFVVSRNGSKWTMYIDGVERGIIGSAAAGNVNLNMMSIGTSLKWISTNEWPNDTIVRNFSGNLDEFTVWSGTMLPHQIAELAAIVSPMGDITADLAVGIDDLGAMSSDWLISSVTDVQDNYVLEDMDSYDPNDPNTFNVNWPYVAEDNFADLVRTIVKDDDYGKVLKLDYDFTTGGIHGHMTETVANRGVGLRIYDTINIRIKTPEGSKLSQIILDMMDGRDKVAPLTEELYNKGRIVIDIADVPTDEWVVVSGVIPSDSLNMKSCTDLYQINFSIGLADDEHKTGTIYIDSIELADGTEDCVPVLGAILPDLNGDCNVDLLDFGKLAEGWLDGVN